MFASSEAIYLDWCAGREIRALFLTANLLDIAVPNRSGRFIDVGCTAGCVPRSSFACVFSAASHSPEARWSLALEFERDRVALFELENNDVKFAIEERDLSELTLEDLLDLPIGCFLVRQRGSLLNPGGSWANSASSIFLNRLSFSFLSSSSRFEARFSLPLAELLQAGETRCSDPLMASLLANEARVDTDPG